MSNLATDQKVKELELKILKLTQLISQSQRTIETLSRENNRRKSEINQITAAMRKN